VTSAERAISLDSSAIVKLAVAEPESAARRAYLRRRRPLVSRGRSRTEGARALLPLGAHAVQRGAEVLRRIELVRVSDRILELSGTLLPAELRSLDAVHLATAEQLGTSLSRLVTYDQRMTEAAEAMGWTVQAPGR
jgi:predicted nucleic acid-binding protein